MRLEPKTMATLDSIADEIGFSRNELMQSMVKFGLTNRDWRNEGLTAHKRLPRYQENPDMATKPPSAAQLAARKRFAEMARSGSLNRKRQIAAKKRATNPTTAHKPVASKGFISYRYKGPYGYIMIGATDDDDALKEARRSSSKPVTIENLEIWDGKKYVPVFKNNPRKKTVSSKPARATPKSSTVYVVEYSKDGKKWDTWMKVMYLDMAKAIAERLAIDPYHKNHYIRVESIREVV